MSCTTLKRARLQHPQKPAQCDLAVVAGVDQAYYSRLESGEANASPEAAHALAAYFKLKIDQLFTPARYSTLIDESEAA